MGGMNGRCGLQEVVSIGLEVERRQGGMLGQNSLEGEAGGGGASLFSCSVDVPCVEYRRRVNEVR